MLNNSFMDRLFPDGRPPYRARDFVHGDLTGVPFTELLAKVGDRGIPIAALADRHFRLRYGPVPPNLADMPKIRMDDRNARLKTASSRLRKFFGIRLQPGRGHYAVAMPDRFE